MITGTQTLFNWSLRSDIRSIYPHVVRAGFCGFLLIAVLAAWADSLSRTAPGLAFFQWICTLNVLLISVSGISYFVTAVTEEKDAGTLALLRLAGVSPLAIVLSKSTSRLISALMLLVIQLPFTFLAITLGGVTIQQVLSAYLTLAAWLCLVANMALFCSVRCNTSGRAASLATAMLLLFFASGPILQGFAGLAGVSWIPPEAISVCQGLLDQQQQMSPVIRLDEIFATPDPELFGRQFWSNFGIGTALFALSVALFNRYSAPTEANPHGESAALRRFTVGRCWRLPIAWKDFLFFMGGRSFLLIKMIGYFGLLAGFMWFHNLEQPSSSDWISRDLVRTAFYTAAGLLTIELLLYASNSLFLEVRQQAIPVLRMLPLSTPALLLQKLAAWLVSLTPVLSLMLVTVLLDPEGILLHPDFAESVVAWLFLTLLSTHLTVLLSLYTRWAALPLAILVTAIAAPCTAGAAIGLFKIAEETAALNGIYWGVWAGVTINFVWMWIFILLPIEVEIVNRWNRLSRE